MGIEGTDPDIPSIPLMIFKELAGQFRTIYGSDFDIKAHPVHKTASTLIFKNNHSKIRFNLFAGDLDLLLAVIRLISVPQVKSWVDRHRILNQPFGSRIDTGKYIITVDIVKGNKLADSKHPPPIGINLSEPGSLEEIRNWISSIVQHA